MSGVSCRSTVSATPKQSRPNGYSHHQAIKRDSCSCFRMPLHYPRYKKSDYETMPEWRLDCLLKEYGLPVVGDDNQKRKFAMGAFLWPSEKE
ncbi:hypothetical protein OIU79_010204 [Salix purpurea]|uniref:DUF7722 domain-containing protein n=1 Tax=Salix purpurea TaxID=77065 RepID=A0A9Q0T9I7_SALPP|nr:hypothetical protein OIU79_010204 [Salix purpurea]